MITCFPEVPRSRERRAALILLFIRFLSVAFFETDRGTTTTGFPLRETEGEIFTVTIAKAQEPV